MSSEPVVHLGLEGIIATRTRLSKVDGEAGKLTIAGFSVEDIASKATYEEMAYLLWYDKLPSKSELEGLKKKMIRYRTLPEATMFILKEAGKVKTHPMDALRMACSTLSLSDVSPNTNAIDANLERAIKLVACFPTIVASYWRYRNGKNLIRPRDDLGHGANFLYMLTGEEPNPAKARAMETYWNTVIDHGLNVSTFAARVIISTQSDIISAITGAIGALKGPLHGGAPGPALDMVFEIGSPDKAETYVKAKLAHGERLMGFGHRIYKVRDPRAEVLSQAAKTLFETVGDLKLQNLYNNVHTIEEIILRVLEEDKPGRKIRTNVEFYTALVLHGIGINTDLFSSCFAIGRVAGWTAQVLEQQRENRIIRPNDLYVGEYDRKWVPLEQRK